MDKPRNCGCKGCRTCLLCEEEYKIAKKDFYHIFKAQQSYVYCPYCNLAWPGWNQDMYKEHPNHSGEPINYPGVYIDLNFLTIDEETQLMQDLDALPWDLSQSGRRKQNYGPKCNFKKQKLKLGDFNGFPKSTEFVQKKFPQVPILKDFQTIEQCSLEYDPKKGASIDPHIDDCWIWGERIVTVNLLSDSILTMHFYAGDKEKYNLPCVKAYSRQVPENFRENEESVTNQDIVVRIPMPRRSLLVLYGAPRYDWEHSVLREDIFDRRVCLAYREFTPPYLPSAPKANQAAEIIEHAKHFWDDKIKLC